MDDDKRDDRHSIERWWPDLSIESKHAVLEDVDGPLPEGVLDEIERLTGRPHDRDRLDHDERDFVRTQTEPVD